MGITIHYRGRAPSRDAVDKIMMTVTNMACQWDWPCAQVEDPDGEIVRMIEDARSDDPPGIAEFHAENTEAAGVEIYQGPVYMLVTQPGEGCEPLRLMFDRDWRMDGFTKTQYGPIETHVKVCRVLRAIERFFDEFEVTDESGFWESDDLKALEARRGDHFDPNENATAQYEAAKRKRDLDNMYKIGRDDEDDTSPP